MSAEPGSAGTRRGERGPVDALDVSDLTVAGLRAYARSAAPEREVHVERRGGRTYLVARQ